MTDKPEPEVRPLGPPVSVPVFNCRVLVSRGESGIVQAEAAELAGLTETAATEREALQMLVARFKKQVAEYTSANQEIPWIKPGRSVQPGEKEYFIAVHL